MNLFAEDANFISVDYTFLDSPYDFPKYYDKITSMGNLIGIDTETTGLDYHSDKVIMVQISNGYDTYVIDVRNIELKKHKPIKDYLENESVLKIAQNATFDYSMLKMSSGIEMNNLYCTKVAEQVISAGKDPAEKFNLAAIVKKRLGFTLEKEIRTSFLNTYNLPFSDSQILYGARDAYILPEIYNQQQIDIEKYGLQEVIDLEMKCIAPLSDMTLHGCLIDTDKWRLIIKYAGIFQEKVDKQLRKDFSDVATQQTLFGEVPINLKSQPQLLSYLRKLGVPLETTSVKELKDYENTYEAVAHLLEYRRYEKIRSSYGEELLSKIKTSTGRLHPQYNQTAAKTGRMSSCFPAGTQILTNTGYKAIETISDNDYVATRFGFKKVVSQWKSGKDWLYEVVCSNNVKLRLTGNHPILTPNGWVNSENLTTNDRVYQTQTVNLVKSEPININYLNENDYWIPTNTKQVYTKPLLLDENLAELIGYATGDGHLRKGRLNKFKGQRYDKMTLAVSWEDKDLVNYLDSLVYKIFGIKTSYRENTSREVQITSTQACMLLSKFGLQKKSVNASVHDLFFSSNYRVVSSFLRGLFEADGCISDGEVKLKSSSLKLLEQVQLLLQQFGILSSIRECIDFSGFTTKNSRYELRIYGTRSLQNYKEFIGFLSNRKKKLLNSECFVTTKTDSADTFSPTHLGWGIVRNKLGELNLVNRLMPNNEYSSSLSQFLRNNKKCSWNKAIKIYNNISIEEKNKYPLNLITNIVETNLREIGLKSIVKTNICTDVYDLCIEDVHEFQVLGVVVKNSEPNSQQFPRGKEFVDKLIPADLKNEEVYSLLKSSNYVLPEKSLEDKDAKDSEKYSLIGKLSSGEVLYVDRQEGLYYYIPDFRECFKPSPGYKIVQLDFPQAEMRIMAALSGDRVMLDAFANNQDVYKRTAAEALKIPYDKVDKKQRTNFKSVLLGLGYGLSPFGLARNLKISKDEAEDIFNRFHHAFPVLSAWLEKTGAESFKRGYADTVLGRRRWLPFLIDPNKQQDEAETLMHALIREGKNMPMQGCLNGNCNIFVKGVGYRNISSFVGDNVEVWDGSKFSKASVLYSGKKQLVKVTLWGGYYIECSPNHKFLATKRNGKSFWIEAQNLTSGDYVSINNKIPEWKYDVGSEFVPRFEMNSGNSKCTSIFDINNDFQRGEWLGRVASDGSILKEGVRLLIAEHEETIIPYIRKITSEMGYISESSDIKEGCAQKMYRLQINSRELSRYLNKQGIKNRIPDFVWSSSDMLRGYLRGMFDGDGTVSPSRCRGGSTISLCFGKGRSFHINWAREIQQALSLFGIRSRVRPNRGRIDVCIVRRDVPEFCDKIGFINPEKQNKALKIGAGTRQKYGKIYGNSSRVKEIEITNEFVDMYDVVNSESGMFMSNGIITHNSNSDLTKKCLVYIYNEIKKRKLPAHLMLVVHDEFVGEALEEYAKEVALVFEECADRAFAELFPQVPTHCEALIGDYWVK